MNVVTTRDLHAIIDLSKCTLLSYLSNYKFNKFRITYADGITAQYDLCDKFLSTLYTCLCHRNKIKSAERLKKYYNDYNIKILDWEEFIR